MNIIESKILKTLYNDAAFDLKKIFFFAVTPSSPTILKDSRIKDIKLN